MGDMGISMPSMGGMPGMPGMPSMGGIAGAATHINESPGGLTGSFFLKNKDLVEQFVIKSRPKLEPKLNEKFEKLFDVEAEEGEGGAPSAGQNDESIWDDVKPIIVNIIMNMSSYEELMAKMAEPAEF